MSNRAQQASLPAEDERKSRDLWNNKVEFLLSLIGFSVGLGNIWRFPYLAYKYGGGTFIFSYVIMMVLVGKPVFLLELIIGQFTGAGAFHAFNCFPLCRGVGISMFLVSFTVSIYYNVLITYALVYSYYTFSLKLPWTRCDPAWIADEQECFVRTREQLLCKHLERYFFNEVINGRIPNSTSNGTALTFEKNSVFIPRVDIDNYLGNCTKGYYSSSEGFLTKKVWGLSSGIDDIGSIKPDLLIALLINWGFVFLCTFKGVKSQGKAVYLTATTPYLLMGVLFTRAITLEGALNGIRYILVPDFNKLLDFEVWQMATSQAFFSLSCAFGALIVSGSHNPFRNQITRDVITVSLVDLFTSVLGSFTVFSVLGNMAFNLNVDISEVVNQGLGLAFITYPEAVSPLNFPEFWAVTFFLTLLFLGVDSEAFFLQTCSKTFLSEIGYTPTKETMFSATYCLIGLLLGIPLITQGGPYIFNLVDAYAGGYVLMYIGTMEVTAVAWFYGIDNIKKDIRFMLGKDVSPYWIICWKFIAPVLLSVLFTLSLLSYRSPTFGSYVYPVWSEVIGFFIMLVIVLCVPGYALYYYLIKCRGDWKLALKPNTLWGPPTESLRKKYFKIEEPEEIPEVDATEATTMATGTETTSMATGTEEQA